MWTDWTGSRTPRAKELAGPITEPLFRRLQEAGNAGLSWEQVRDLQWEVVPFGPEHFATTIGHLHYVHHLDIQFWGTRGGGNWPDRYRLKSDAPEG